MTVTEFLEARIAEDEALAHAVVLDATVRRLGKWEESALDVGEELPGPRMTAKFSPDRVLAECAAKRAIIAAHPIVDDVVEVSTRIKHGFACETCFSYGDIVEDNGYCDTLRALAAVYADHADYRQEWAL